MPKIYIQLLGAPEIRLNGEVVRPRRQKSIALLAYLITEYRLHSRERLASTLWPDSDNPRKQLRQAVYDVRQLIGPEALVVNRDTIGINQDLATQSDFCRLRQFANDTSGTASELKLELIKALCSGDFLEGFLLDECEFITGWCDTTQKLTDHWRENLLGEQVAACRARGDTDAALDLLITWQRLDRFSETVHKDMIELYLQRGDPRSAERVFNEFKYLLRDQLDVTPPAYLTEMVAGIAPGIGSSVERVHQSSPQTHYIQSGSAFIAYQTLGDGPVNLFFVNGFMSHLEQIWENRSLSRFYRRLAGQFRIILFDKRGSGMSDRVSEPPTPEEIASDIHQLMYELELEQTVLFGFSEGGAAAIEFAARYPESTDRIILCGTAAKWCQDADYKPALTAAQFDLWRDELIQQWGAGDSILAFAPSEANNSETTDWWAKTMRLSSSPGEVEKILCSIRDIDVRPRLSKIKCPVCILHKTEDPIVRFEAAKDLAKRLSKARLKPVRGRDHWFWTEDAEQILTLIADEAGAEASPQKS